MAAYPAFDQLVGSTIDYVDDIELDRAVGGGVRGRAFFPVKKAVITLRHLMTATDLATLMTFYDTNRLNANTVTWTGAGGGTFTMWFDGPPKPTPEPQRPSFTRVDVRFEEQ